MKKLGRQNYFAWRKLYSLLILLYSLIVCDGFAQNCLSVDCSNLQELNLQCDVDIPLPDLNAVSVLGSCGNIAISSSDVFLATGTGCIGSEVILERTYTITDDVNTPDTADDEILTCVQLMTIADTEAPAFTNEPLSVTVEYSDTVEDEFNAWVNANGYAQVFEDCQSYDWITDPAMPQIQYDCACTGSGTVLFSAVDACGNAVAASATFFVEDTTLPIITVEASDQILECTGTDYTAVFEAWLANNGGAQATDACNLSWRTEPPAPEIISYCGGTTTVPVAFIASDDCGNEASTNAEFRIVDTQPPTWSFVPEDLTISCDEPVVFGEPAASDDCSDVIIESVDSETSGNYCDGSIVFTRTWSVHDACQMTTTEVAQNITVLDTEGPVLSAVHPLLVGLSDYDTITFNCNNITYFAAADFVATDNCGPNPVVTMIDPVIGNAECVDGVSQQLLCTWTAADACGNESDFNIVINIVDDTSPVFSFVPADEAIECGEEVVFGEPIVIDDCSEFTITSSVDGNTVGCTTTQIMTWTATDACGNTSTASQSIVSTDTMAPEFTFVPADADVACGDNIVFGDVEYVDACGDVTLTSEDSEVVEACSITYTRIWTATDACGLTATAAQVITATDTEAPVFDIAPADLTIGCDVMMVFDDPTATDNCSEVVVTVENINGNGNCNEPYTRIWTATDQCGLSTVISQTIYVVDSDPPVITFTPPDATIDCAETPNFGEIEAMDFCGAATIVAVDTSIAEGCAVLYTRTWTVNDACGNISTAVQTITAVDALAPMVSGITEYVEIGCQETPVFDEPVAVDDCGDVTLSSADSEIIEDCGITYIRTWTAVDACGNENITTQTIAAIDNSAPVFDFVPYDLGIACNEPIVFGDPLVSDDCSDVSITFVDSPVEGMPFYGLNQIRTWTATDACGNSATASQQIWVAGDDTPPVFTYVPEAESYICGEAYVIDDPIAVDDCSDVTITYTEVDNGGNCTFGIDVTRTWIATDAAGNTAEVSITYWLVPPTEPLLFEYIPESFTSNVCDEAPAFGTPIPASACTTGDIMMVHADERTDGACASSYTMTRTWTATDNCGQSATCSQTITIEDLEAPFFMIAPVDLDLNCGDAMTGGEPVAMDNCNGGVTLTYDDVSTILECDEVVTRTWTAMDDCGNQRTAVQTITVADYVNPVFTFVPESMEVECGTDIVFGTPTYEDNCSAVSISVEDMVTPGDCSTGYESTRIWTAMDACGNETTAMQTIAVLAENTGIQFDEEPLSFNISCGQQVVFGTVSAQTVCAGDVQINQVDNVTETACEKIHTRTWTATDACGNQEVISQTITVVDDVAPNFSTYPEDLTISCGEAIEFEPVAVRDRCSSTSFAHVDEVANLACSTVYTRTWTAVDACGNEATNSQKITVMNSGALAFEYFPEDEVVACGTEYEFATPVVMDNCSIVNLDFQDADWSGNNPGETRTVRTWTASDACGNVISASQEITFVDEAAPVFYLYSPTPVEVNIRDWDRHWEPNVFVFDQCNEYTIEGPARSRRSVCNGLIIGYTYTATDAAGNVSQHTYELNLITRPRWHCDHSIVDSTVDSTEAVDMDDEDAIEIEELGLSDFDLESKDVTEPFEVKLYPNPATDFIAVNYFSNDDSADTEIVIFNMVGQQVFSQKAIASKGENLVKLDVTNLPTSNYMVRIKVGNQLTSRKLLITRK